MELVDNFGFNVQSSGTSLEVSEDSASVESLSLTDLPADIVMMLMGRYLPLEDSYQLSIASGCFKAQYAAIGLDPKTSWIISVISRVLKYAIRDLSGRGVSECDGVSSLQALHRIHGRVKELYPSTVCRIFPQGISITPRVALRQRLLQMFYEILLKDLDGICSKMKEEEWFMLSELCIKNLEEMPERWGYQISFPIRIMQYLREKIANEAESVGEKIVKSFHEWWGKICSDSSTKSKELFYFILPLNIDSVWPPEEVRDPFQKALRRNFEACFPFSAKLREVVKTQHIVHNLTAGDDLLQDLLQTWQCQGENKDTLDNVRLLLERGGSVGELCLYRLLYQLPEATFLQLLQPEGNLCSLVHVRVRHYIMRILPNVSNIKRSLRQQIQKKWKFVLESPEECLIALAYQVFFRHDCSLQSAGGVSGGHSTCRLLAKLIEESVDIKEKWCKHMDTILSLPSLPGRDIYTFFIIFAEPQISSETLLLMWDKWSVQGREGFLRAFLFYFYNNPLFLKWVLALVGLSKEKVREIFAKLDPQLVKSVWEYAFGDCDEDSGQTKLHYFSLYIRQQQKLTDDGIAAKLLYVVAFLLRGDSSKQSQALSTLEGKMRQCEVLNLLKENGRWRDFSLVGWLKDDPYCTRVEKPVGQCTEEILKKSRDLFKKVGLSPPEEICPF